MNSALRPLLLLWVILLLSGCAGLERHRNLVVADPAPPRSVRTGVRVTYLGTNGYLLESADTVLLVDPFFSRVGRGAVLANAKIAPDDRMVDRALARLPRRELDAVLVTHGHFDHLLDVPAVMQRHPGATLIASPTSVALAGGRALPVRPGHVVRTGGAIVRVMEAGHDKVLGVWMPYPGEAQTLPPQRVSDWRCGTALAFLIEMGGRRIYLDSGGSPEILPPADLGPVDLAILGVALKGSRQRLKPILRQLKPRYVLPSHQDDFFRPLRRGFRFGQLTDFPGVRRAAASAAPTAELILLDYFQPWTLP